MRSSTKAFAWFSLVLAPPAASFLVRLFMTQERVIVCNDVARALAPGLRPGEPVWRAWRSPVLPTDCVRLQRRALHNG